MSDFRYQIDEHPVASGSQGSVHFALRSDGLPVAVKIAAPGRTAADAVRREVQLLRALGESGIGGVVPCLDAIELGGRPALVMPQYPSHMGHWLQQVIQHPGPDTLADILDKIARLAWSLGRVHEAAFEAGTLVHRDVKPENIFLDEHGEPWIGDFGGAMAIEGLEAVELALFGTPMWAPLDQILPGRAIPDPTWDTYALCVLLYAALTGARPAYQSDPRTLLTDAGTALWDAARRAVEAPPEDRSRWNRRFATMRTGTRGFDLIDPTGHAALVDSDREVLEQGLHRLCGLAGVDDAGRQVLLRGLWNLLTRGLSPLSHPSPPNRYRSGLELGETLDELRAVLQDRTRRAPLADEPALSSALDRPVSSSRNRLLFWTAAGFLVGLALLIVAIAGLLLLRGPLRLAVQTSGWAPERVLVEDGLPFELDATEGTTVPLPVVREAL